MSLDILAKEIERFLNSEKAEVLCITGKWGVGKTYAWNHYLKIALTKGSIKLKRYSYVSLFGRNSIEDVRDSIVENTVSSEAAGTNPDLTTFNKMLEGTVKLAGFASKLGKFIPQAREYAISANRIMYLNLKNQIICLDDLERAGKDLAVNDVLGLISSLKEEKKCKIVLLLNEEMLSEEGKQNFRNQLEKVTDIFFIFNPTVEEAVNIGIDIKNSFSEQLKEDCTKLGITNIRLLKKIESSLVRLEEVFSGFDSRIFEQVIHTLALGYLGKFQPERQLSIEYLLKYTFYSDYSASKDGITEAEQTRKNLLQTYPYTESDELDVPLLQGIDKGYFDVEVLQAKAKSVQARFKLQDLDNSFGKVWSEYRESLNLDEKDFLNRLYDSAIKSYESISLGNLDSTLALLKEFGKKAEAKKLLKHYVDNRVEDSSFWDLEENVFGSDITDPDLLAAIKKKFDGLYQPTPNLDVLMYFADSGWNDKMLSQISKMSETEFYKLFKSLSGPSLRKAIKGATRFRLASDPNEYMTLINKNVLAALKRIAGENRLSARVIEQWGIKFDEPITEPKKVVRRSKRKAVGKSRKR